MKLNGLYIKISERTEDAINFAKETDSQVEDTYGCFVDTMDGDHTHFEDAKASGTARVPVAYIVGGRIYVSDVRAFYVGGKEHEGFAYVEADKFMEMIG